MYETECIRDDIDTLYVNWKKRAHQHQELWLTSSDKIYKGYTTEQWKWIENSSKQYKSRRGALQIKGNWEKISTENL